MATILFRFAKAAIVTLSVLNLWWLRPTSMLYVNHAVDNNAGSQSSSTQQKASNPLCEDCLGIEKSATPVNLSFVNITSSSSLGTYSHSSTIRSDVDATNGTVGLSPFRILCTSTPKFIRLGSFKIRCLEFKLFAAKYFPNVEIDAIPAENATGHYDATILVKKATVLDIQTPAPTMYGRVFVDVVDGYYLKPMMISKEFDVIVQNQAHTTRYPNHRTHVVTHWYNSFLADDKDEFFGTLPAIKHEDHLKVATVWESQKGCWRSQLANVSYDCIQELYAIQEWYHKYVPGDTTFNRTMADPELGTGYLYRNLFQKYHLLVAYAKNMPKLKFGNVQRIVSQMRSGVPVLVEDRGYAHSEFIRKYSYPCKFTDDQSFQEMLERMKSPLVRQECQRLGIEICKDYSPHTIIREFLRVLGMFE
jgi:hypothetical protein